MQTESKTTKTIAVHLVAGQALETSGATLDTLAVLKDRLNKRNHGAFHLVWVLMETLTKMLMGHRKATLKGHQQG